MDVVQSVQQKLNVFYKKYYLTQFWIGLIFSSVILSLCWYFLSISEYFIYFPKAVKTLIFILFLLGTLIVLWFKVVLPLLLFFKIKKGLQDEDIAKIIGNHFKNQVDDVLLNSIQLSYSSVSSPIVFAAIEQKFNHIKDYNFIQAIDKTLLKQWLKLATIPGVLFLFTLLFQPQIILEGSSRAVQFNRDFYPPNPYNFKIINTDFTVFKNEPFLLKVEFFGNKIPENLYLVFQNQSLRFTQKGNYYEIQVPPIQKSTDFVLRMGEFYSDSYNFNLVQKPSIQNFKINVFPPKYTSIEPFSLSNQQFIQVPQGSKVVLDLVFSQCNQLQINNSVFKLSSSSFSYSFDILNDKQFNIQSNQDSVFFSDDLSLNFNVIKDNYPEISLKSFTDSIFINQVYFSVSAKDDYGISKTELIIESNDSMYKSVLKLPKNELSQQFNYSLDMNRFKNFGNDIKVYFKTWDNDFRGNKFAVSSSFSYSFPSAQKVDSLVNKSKDELKSLMNNTLNSIAKQQMDIQSIQDDLLQKSSLDWNDKKRLDNLFKQQQNLENQIQNIQKLQEIQKNKENNLKDLDPDLLDKQKQIEELFDKLLDPETKKLFDELQKLMNDLKNKNEVQNVLDKMQKDNKQIEQSVDRTLEMFKRFEVEQLLEESINKLKDLSKNQEDIRNQLDKFSKDDALKKQDDLNKSFQDLTKKIEDLKDKNKVLERPKKMEDLSKDVKSIQEKLNSIQQSIGNNDKSKAKNSQKSVEQDLKNMANKLENLMAKQAQEQDSEDVQVLRQILENLLYLSNSQEDVLAKSKLINPLDPKFTSLANEQKKLLNDAKIIEDSLVALSKRQIQIKDLVTNELFNLTNNLKLSQDLMFKRQPYNAIVKQQFVMTSANNLALMLDESLQKMQEQMKNSQPGSGSCSKPGGKNPKPSDSMGELKDMLAKQIEQMKKQMEKGSIPGDNGSKGNKGSAKDFAQMAAQQAAMKEKLKELEKQLQKQGNGGAGDAPQLLKEFENIEKDLYNKNLSNELINRQKKIMTKLLEAEKGLLEQELDEKRKGETAKFLENRNFSKPLLYKSTDLNTLEQLNKYNPNFNLYYKSKISVYFNNFEQP